MSQVFVVLQVGRDALSNRLSHGISVNEANLWGMLGQYDSILNTDLILVREACEEVF